MSEEKGNGFKIILICSIILISFCLFMIFVFSPWYNDNHEQRTIEFDNKWGTACNELGGLYLEDGWSHMNNCYVNDSNGVLYKTLIVELKGNYYLQGDCIRLDGSR